MWFTDVFYQIFWSAKLMTIRAMCLYFLFLLPQSCLWFWHLSKMKNTVDYSSIIRKFHSPNVHWQKIYKPEVAWQRSDRILMKAKLIIRLIAINHHQHPKLCVIFCKHQCVCSTFSSGKLIATTWFHFLSCHTKTKNTRILNLFCYIPAFQHCCVFMHLRGLEFNS